tara:strand:- start:682 stop:870 length:189 start_codon:yes stop_codon:yes gene_type:complete
MEKSAFGKYESLAWLEYLASASALILLIFLSIGSIIFVSYHAIKWARQNIRFKKEPKQPWDF